MTTSKCRDGINYQMKDRVSFKSLGTIASENMICWYDFTNKAYLSLVIVIPRLRRLINMIGSCAQNEGKQKSKDDDEEIEKEEDRFRWKEDVEKSWRRMGEGRLEWRRLLEEGRVLYRYSPIKRGEVHKKLYISTSLDIIKYIKLSETN